jgi:hypothetical protein
VTDGDADEQAAAPVRLIRTDASSRNGRGPGTARCPLSIEVKRRWSFTRRLFVHWFAGVVSAVLRLSVKRLAIQVVS